MGAVMFKSLIEACDAYMDRDPERFRARAPREPADGISVPPGITLPADPDLPVQPPVPLDGAALHPGEVPAQTKREAISLGEAYAPFSV